MTDRCEPSEELRGRDGWHIVATGEAHSIARWDSRGRCWESGISVGDWTRAGVVYVGPYTPPAVVAALAEALAEMMSALAHPDRRSLAMGFRFLRATSNARAALAAYREGPC